MAHREATRKQNVTTSKESAIFLTSASILSKAEAQLQRLTSENLQEQRLESHLSLKQGQRRDITKLLRGVIATDILAMLVGFVCAWALAAIVNIVFLHREFIDPLSDGDFLRGAQFLGIAAGVVLWFEHRGHYRVRMPFWLEIEKVVGTMALAIIIDGFLQFASKQDFSRVWLISNWAFAAVGIMGLRVLWRSRLRRKGVWEIPALLVGGGTMAEDARAALESEPALGYKVVAQIEDLPAAFEEAGESWENICAQHGVDYVVIALEGAELTSAGLPLAQLLREAVPFSVSPPLGQLPVLGMVPQYFFNHDVMLLTRSHGLDQPLPRFVKRSFDVVASGFAVLALSPLMIALAVMVKLDGAPAFYGHKRLGLNGKTFQCLKFRSMMLNSEELFEKYLAAHPSERKEWNETQKLRNDPRVTRVGRFLRSASLDELPQLLNVLKGDMSLVGPRPIPPREQNLYGGDIAHYYRLRPGITGLWQVSGRNDVSYAQRVQMDSWYVRNWSLWHDVAILCKTIPVVFLRTGAY
ncbi:MAG: undecaprenyl-phosphate galactose phosphotransferase WbaP [Alphaproteobacteria bacterium]|nr:undecaprenyl-phosphate galactose phosphotransferase WbaP [Alphaproteobacteria bacterium]